MIGRTADELGLGDVVEASRVVRRSDIAEFVDSVGDRNPIHSDDAFAATTSFGEPIAPGVWTAGLISAVIGTRLPGPGSIYLSQDLRFLKPVRVGDTITARVEVVEVIRERNRVHLRTSCVNQRGEAVLDGEAWIAPPRRPVRYDEDRGGVGTLSFWALQPWLQATRAASFWWKLGASTLALGMRPPQKTTGIAGSPYAASTGRQG
ncbi:MAG TPA: MaoC family dehydratase [Actinomycetota bacterium]|nr:MaoC family dehydratase [Actinomycetota bacterium]